MNKKRVLLLTGTTDEQLDYIEGVVSAFFKDYI